MSNDPVPGGTVASDVTATPVAPVPTGYTEALTELESILRELEGSDVDVDRLAERVARAAQLIALCRDRIGHARLQIDDVLTDLDASDHGTTMT